MPVTISMERQPATLSSLPVNALTLCSGTDVRTVNVTRIDRLDSQKYEIILCCHVLN